LITAFTCINVAPEKRLYTTLHLAQINTLMTIAENPEPKTGVRK
jgi:hypothetical protein